MSPMLKPDTGAIVPATTLDEVRLFMLFAMFGGDCKRVAAASPGVELSQIVSLAHDFHWKDRLSNRAGLATVEGAEEERAINRASSYVTAERLSRVIGKLIDDLDNDPAKLKAFCTELDSDGIAFGSTKSLVELAKALQIINDVKYRALQDKQAQAAELVNGPSDPASLSLAVFRGLRDRFDRVATAASIDVMASTILAAAVPKETNVTPTHNDRPDGVA